MRMEIAIKDSQKYLKFLVLTALSLKMGGGKIEKTKKVNEQ